MPSIEEVDTILRDIVDKHFQGLTLGIWDSKTRDYAKTERPTAAAFKKEQQSLDKDGFPTFAWELLYKPYPNELDFFCSADIYYGKALRDPEQVVGWQACDAWDEDEWEAHNKRLIHVPAIQIPHHVNRFSEFLSERLMRHLSLKLGDVILGDEGVGELWYPKEDQTFETFESYLSYFDAGLKKDYPEVFERLVLGFSLPQELEYLRGDLKKKD